MTISQVTALVWRLAASEAAAAHYENIEPEHVFMAIMSFSEAGEAELRSSVAIDLSIDGFLMQRDLVSAILEWRDIYSTAARRHLRKQLGTGQEKAKRTTIHRSPACRQLFTKASSLVSTDLGEGKLQPSHLLRVLLAEPTQAICKAINQSNSFAATIRLLSDLPYYTNILEWTNKVILDSLDKSEVARLESKALLDILLGLQKKSIIVIGAQESQVNSILQNVATNIVSREMLDALSVKRIIDIRSAGKDHGDVREIISCHLQLIGKVEGKQHLIIIESLNLWLQAQKEQLDRLLDLIMRRSVQMVLFISLSGFEALRKHNEHWKRAAHVMWVESKVYSDLPHLF